jgi:hypothetical protein
MTGRPGGTPPVTPPQHRRRWPLVLVAVLTALAVAAGLLAWLDRDALPDRIHALFAQTDPEVTQLADRVQLTDRASLRLTATDPELLEADAFTTVCPSSTEDSAVLGCYTGDDRIHISNITDARFDGIREVTLAHELLHAMWSRYDQGTRDQLSARLEAAWTRVATPDLESRLDVYETAEPGERANELHSILGTEVADLGDDELEQHYTTVFADRQAVVALHAGYQAQFDENQHRLDELRPRIEADRAALEARSQAHDEALARYERDSAALEARRSSVDRGDPAQVNAFNAELDRLRARQTTLNAEADAINSDAADLNARIDEYNTLVGSRRELFAAITAGS